MNAPLSNLREVFFFETYKELISLYRGKSGENATIYLTSHRVSLTLIENPTPIGEVFVDKFGKDFLISFSPFTVQDGYKSLEELSCNFWFLLCIY